MTSTLRRWLALRTRDDLVEIFARRPDISRRPIPRDLGEVAERLHYAHGLGLAVRQLPQPCVEVLETLLVFGPGGMTRDALAATLHVAADDAGLDAALRTCEQWALAWEFGDLLHVPGALRSLLTNPLQLGPPVVDLLSPRTFEDLRARAEALGLPQRARKNDILKALEAFYADGNAIRARYQAAPSRQRELLAEAAWQDPLLSPDMTGGFPSRVDPTIAYLALNGLVIGDWQRVVVPREVGIAIRGEGWHPTLTTRAQAGSTTTIGVAAIDRDAAAAANAAIGHIAALVEACGATPLSILKTGGIGVREIRRLAKAIILDESHTRLWLELAYDAELLDTDGDEVVPTSKFDEWLALAPGDQLAALVRAWLDLPVVPLIDQRPPGVAVRAVLTSAPFDASAAELRIDVLRSVAELPAGTGLTDIADLESLVRWRRPLTTAALDEPMLAIEPIWTEAQLLGIIGRGGLSSLGRALIAPDEHGASDLETVAREFATPPATEAIFQADLTIVVPGTPTAAVAALLDSIADRESRGAAGTWRCSPSSVRRALDAGRGPDELLAELRRLAVGGTLPQPLEYLLADVARRHGALRVRALACVVRADDTALLAEIVATKSLTSLGLTLLAPNVLGSSSPVDRTLAQLRAAGYAPVGEDETGAAVIERAPVRRAPKQAVVIQVPTQRPRADHPDLDALAASLLSGTTELEAAPSHGFDSIPMRRVSGVGATPYRIPTLRTIQHYASHLRKDEQHLLAYAIDNEGAVWIEYTGSDGVWTQRVIEPVELDGGTLVAWCRLRDDERNFVLSRIGAVEPV